MTWGIINGTLRKTYHPLYFQKLLKVGIQSGPMGSPPSSVQAVWNTQMLKVCELVNWGFANIRSSWSFLDFKVAMMVFKGLAA
jgi:hypothetical protein